ncbi:MAG: M28 family peptidase [Deltaproteobacteria bacterium]|nr:M28 family peptidase [Deltaproteobacteria bacterium]
MISNTQLLKEVLSLPTAPFHEEAVMSFIQNFCKKLKLICLEDSYGNLKVIYKKGSTKPMAFAAHMDHPGFETIRGGSKPVVELLGGVPDKYFLKAKVVFCENGHLIRGKVSKVFNKKKRQFLVTVPRPVAKGSFGYFDLVGVKIEKGIIYTKAADNVMSVAILLTLLKELVGRKPKTHVICLFTRAEEVGFVGAFGVIHKKFLSKKIPLVVMESSSALAGRVAIGGGPVLRVGDRFSIFSYTVDLWLKLVAEKLKKSGNGFEYQRALLPGGRCEASLYVEEGYQVGGLAFPLGNYHNIGPKNYGLEYVSLKDYQNMLKWLLTLAESPLPNEMLRGVNKSVDAVFKKYSGRLTTVIASEAKQSR